MMGRGVWVLAFARTTIEGGAVVTLNGYREF